MPRDVCVTRCLPNIYRRLGEQILIEPEPHFIVRFTMDEPVGALCPTFFRSG
jgi:hypothetical protein